MLLAMFGAQSVQAHDVVHAQVDASGDTLALDECMDTNDSCRTWAADGECSSNPGFMHVACRESCSMSRPRPVRPASAAQMARLVESGRSLSA